MEEKVIRAKAEVVAKKLILKGFDCANDDLEAIAYKTFGRKNKRGCKIKVDRYVDFIVNKIDKLSNYLEVTDEETGEKYYYFTVKEMHEDTGMTRNTITGSIYGYYLANGRYRVEKKYFTAEELLNNKTKMFNKKLGKVDVRVYYTKRNNHRNEPLKVIDTKTNDVKVYSTGDEYCELTGMKTYNLGKYINNGFRHKKRYILEKVD